MISRLSAFVPALLAAFLALGAAAPAQARDITDMAGRKIVVPDKITRVYSASYPLTLLFYVLA
ncbi:MAG: iron ABC transporter substrate-binding protein, partial [Alphaproteobacteria bacterium]|nr:iron ABC transporter substrate-binding protein [Alphaproteobacteria bacterium]